MGGAPNKVGIRLNIAIAFRKRVGIFMWEGASQGAPSHCMYLISVRLDLSSIKGKAKFILHQAEPEISRPPHGEG